MKLCTCLILLMGTMLANVSGQTPLLDESYTPPEHLTAFKISHDICLEKTEASEEVIKEFKDDEIHEDSVLNHYIYYMDCILQDLNIFDNDFEMRFEKLRKWVQPSGREYNPTGIWSTWQLISHLVGNKFTFLELNYRVDHLLDGLFKTLYKKPC